MKNNKEKIKTELWDDDRGWVSFCESCQKRVEEKDKICPHCGESFTEVKRY